MIMDKDFWDELLIGLPAEELEWLKIRIERRIGSLRPEITARRTIIRKQ